MAARMAEPRSRALRGRETSYRVDLEGCRWERGRLEGFRPTWVDMQMWAATGADGDKSEGDGDKTERQRAAMAGVVTDVDG